MTRRRSDLLMAESSTVRVRVTFESGVELEVDAPALGLTVAEAARLAGFGRDEFYRRIRAGEIKTITYKRKRLVPMSRLLEFLEAASKDDNGRTS